MDSLLSKRMLIRSPLRGLLVAGISLSDHVFTAI